MKLYLATPARNVALSMLLLSQATCLNAASLNAAPAALTPASPITQTAAERLRQVDLLLMVTSLRCRKTPDNFETDFAAFEARHMRELNAAAAQLTRAAGANGPRALDKISTTIANRYGAGHPWLGCADLKALTQKLALQAGAAPVLDAADELLNGDDPTPPPPPAGPPRLIPQLAIGE